MLWAIGELDGKQAATLQQMTPKLQSVYGVQGGDWQQVIASVMEWPPELPDKIRTVWARNLEIAQAHHTNLPPQQFAEMFVDQNLIT